MGCKAGRHEGLQSQVSHNHSNHGEPRLSGDLNTSVHFDPAAAEARTSAEVASWYADFQDSGEHEDVIPALFDDTEWFDTSSPSEANLPHLGKPTPLNDAFVLNAKSRFGVAFDGLEVSGTIPILAECSAEVLLLAQIVRDPSNGAGSVSLLLTEGNSLEGHFSLGTIKSTGQAKMNIYDRFDTLYGEYHYDGDLTYRLYRGDRELAILRYVMGEARTSGQVLFESTVDGSELLRGLKRCEGDSNGGESQLYLEVRVATGMDYVLGLLCMLGAMVLG